MVVQVGVTTIQEHQAVQVVQVQITLIQMVEMLYNQVNLWIQVHMDLVTQEAEVVLLWTNTQVAEAVVPGDDAAPVSESELAMVLSAAEGTLSGVGSTLRLDAVSVPDSPSSAQRPVGAVTWTRRVGSDDRVTIDATNFGVAPIFAVTSGPCTVSDGGRCVGRPEGYGPDEDCAITVGGGGGWPHPDAHRLERRRTSRHSGATARHALSWAKRGRCHRGGAPLVLPAACDH